MTYLGESQFAAGLPTFVPDSWTFQPGLAGMDAHLGQMNFGKITSFLINIARWLSVPFWVRA